MKLVYNPDSEFNNLIKIFRTTVTVEFELVSSVYSATEIEPLKNPDGSWDQRALDLYEEFIINALEVFGEFDFEVLEERESPYSKSVYYSLVKEQDLQNYDYKYILFIRISDHENNKDTKAQKKAYYDKHADELKQPVTKSKQTWKLKEITVNKNTYDSYEDALEDIRNRLKSLK